MRDLGLAVTRRLMRHQSKPGRAIAEGGTEDRHLFAKRLEHDTGAGLRSLSDRYLPISPTNSRDEYGRGSRLSVILCIVSSQMRSSSSSISVS